MSRQTRHFVPLGLAKHDPRYRYSGLIEVYSWKELKTHHGIIPQHHCCGLIAEKGTAASPSPFSRRAARVLINQGFGWNAEAFVQAPHYGEH